MFFLANFGKILFYNDYQTDFMINNLHIKNFKSLKEVDLELRNLNLLTGLNSAGKSSVIQVLLLLRQSKELCSQLSLSLNSSMVDVGTVNELPFRGKTKIEDLFSFLLHFENQTKLFIETNSISETSTKSYAALLNKITFTNNIRPDANYVVDLQPPNKNTQDIYLVENQLKEQALFNKNFQYLYTEREFKKDGIYEPNISEVIGNKALGYKGEHTAFYLSTYAIDKKVASDLLHNPKAKSDYLIDQVNAWLSEISPNVHIKVELNEGKVNLKFGYEKHFFEPKNVGFGLSYVLPVIVALLTAEKGKLIIIENPESHIHPRGQAELGKLLAAAAQTGAQLIVETHSDHILNGIRVAVKEKLISPDNVVAYYFKKDEEEHSSQVTPIFIDVKGKLHSKTAEGISSKIPKGFFDEWTNSMAKLF